MSARCKKVGEKIFCGICLTPSNPKFDKNMLTWHFFIADNDLLRAAIARLQGLLQSKTSEVVVRGYESTKNQGLFAICFRNFRRIKCKFSVKLVVQEGYVQPLSFMSEFWYMSN